VAERLLAEEPDAWTDPEELALRAQEMEADLQDARSRAREARAAKAPEVEAEARRRAESAAQALSEMGAWSRQRERLRRVYADAEASLRQRQRIVREQLSEAQARVRTYQQSLLTAERERNTLARQAADAGVSHAELASMVGAEHAKYGGIFGNEDVSTTVGQPKILSAWVQYQGASHVLTDLTSDRHEQHVDAVPNEVLFLPVGVCKLLRAPAATPWAVQTVIPGTLTSTHDPATGLDQMFTSEVVTWGIRKDGTAYFDAEGAQAGEASRLFLIAGQPSLNQ
jgi:hypothetical protein